jgi:glutathione S-transferase
LAGPELTAADIVAYPGLKLLLRASRHPEAAPLALCLDGFETRFPGIAAWMQRVEQLPGYEKTIRRIGGRLREPGSPGVTAR